MIGDNKFYILILIVIIKLFNSYYISRIFKINNYIILISSRYSLTRGIFDLSFEVNKKYPTMQLVIQAWDLN